MEMNFDDKFAQCIQKMDDIDTPDYPRNDTNLYADFVELLVVFSKGDGVSFGDILDRFFGEPDEKNTSETNDSNESFVDGIFEMIEERKTLYTDVYPFDIDGDCTVRLKENMTIPQKLYLFLLLSSSLDIFKAFNSEITADFERLSCEAIRSFLPNAIVKPFGKHSEYRGSAKEKIRKLADDIGLPTNEYEIENIGERNNQERGLDIVSWLPFEDKCQNKVVFLCQCACGKQFEFKQHDLRRYEHYYQFYRTKPQRTLFVPYSLINPRKNKFYHSDYVEDGYLLFERLRIINLSKRKEEIFTQLMSSYLVERCVQKH